MTITTAPAGPASLRARPSAALPGAVVLSGLLAGAVVAALLTEMALRRSAELWLVRTGLAVAAFVVLVIASRTYPRR
jgi:protein-S-isoprenylcysteine O-methyltransferase Ste14